MNEREQVREVQERLSEMLGEEVIVDKVANMVRVYRKVETVQLLAEVNEMVLLADLQGGVEHLKHECLVEEHIPDEGIVRLNREQLANQISDIYAMPLNKNKSRGLFVPTEQGMAETETYQIDPELDLRIARNSMARLIKRLIGKDSRIPCTLVVLGDIHCRADSLTNRVSFWFHGVRLKGDWAWDNEAGQMVQVQK